MTTISDIFFTFPNLIEINDWVMSTTKEAIIFHTNICTIIQFGSLLWVISGITESYNFDLLRTLSC